MIRTGFGAYLAISIVEKEGNFQAYGEFESTRLFEFDGGKMNTPVLETERLILRPFKPEDVMDVFDWRIYAGTVCFR